MHCLLILEPEHRGGRWEGSDGGTGEREKGIRREETEKGAGVAHSGGVMTNGEKSDTKREHLPTMFHLSFPSYYSYKVAFVYHQASAASQPALQIKLTAGATGIHYRHQAGSYSSHTGPGSQQSQTVDSFRYLKLQTSPCF